MPGNIVQKKHPIFKHNSIYIYMGIVQNQTRASETAEIQRSGSPFRTRFGEKSQFFLGFKVRYVGPVFRTFLPFWTLVSAEK